MISTIHIFRNKIYIDFSETEIPAVILHRATCSIIDDSNCNDLCRSLFRFEHKLYRCWRMNKAHELPMNFANDNKFTRCMDNLSFALF